ncbi:uncharacterized protein LOC103569827 [Microplitis demolitor]|uniref:uncharacterized protein LOC103569827 n=1 Tax=Microplitis demolitor TaxID=69319 RepID=UPI0004CD86E0|nr:uncharacterized protein LOC103569827 [Microplitis demolitor]
MNYFCQYGFNFYKRNFNTINLLVLFSYAAFFIYIKFYVINNLEPGLSDIEEINVRENLNSIQESKYLVWSSKCRLLDKDPLDESIREFIQPEYFESCSLTDSLLSSVVKEASGNYSIVINKEIAESYKILRCCWSSIFKNKSEEAVNDWDVKFNVSPCQDFEDRVELPEDAEIVKVVCRSNKKFSKRILKVMYENIHAIVNPKRVKDRFQNVSLNNTDTENKKISIFVLGINGISRLNFMRSLPKTAEFLQQKGWINLVGYNKIGDDKFSNIMSILTGQNASLSNAYYNSESEGLNDCPLLWKNFKQAGYVTAYGEDVSYLDSLNFRNNGFIDPPTDYYLKPYIVATENLLKPKYKFGQRYCSGPELTVDRILNYASDFAREFLDRPYFGWFWINSIPHDDINGLSSMDSHLLDQLKNFEQGGVFDNTLVVFLSDHGTRWDEIKNTFIGWYEERLPFVYLRVPDALKNQNIDDSSLDIIQTLKVNKRRLTSPYDLYETLRDILERGGGKASPSSGCSLCQSLLKPVINERGCEDVGVSSHWCTCTESNPQSPTSEIAQQGAQKFLSHIESVVKNYKNEKGERLCAELNIEKIHRFDEIIMENNNTTTKKYFYQIEVAPGNGMYEITMNFDVNKNFEVSPYEISRTNSYEVSASCLQHLSHRKYCYCIN